MDEELTYYPSGNYVQLSADYVYDMTNKWLVAGRREGDNFVFSTSRMEDIDMGVPFRIETCSAIRVGFNRDRPVLAVDGDKLLVALANQHADTSEILVINLDRGNIYERLTVPGKGIELLGIAGRVIYLKDAHDTIVGINMDTRTVLFMLPGRNVHSDGTMGTLSDGSRVLIWVNTDPQVYETFGTNVSEIISVPEGRSYMTIEEVVGQHEITENGIFYRSAFGGPYYYATFEGEHYSVNLEDNRQNVPVEQSYITAVSEDNSSIWIGHVPRGEIASFINYRLVGRHIHVAAPAA